MADDTPQDTTTTQGTTTQQDTPADQTRPNSCRKIEQVTILFRH